MINQMNKHMNHLSWGKLMGLEQKEHNLKRPPTQAEFRKAEQREHNLKTVPSMRKALEAEATEHFNGVEDFVIKGSAAQRKKATAIYKGK
jgi:hypothetical protein